MTREAKRDLIVSLTSNLYYANYLHKPPFNDDEKADFYLSESEKVNKWGYEDWLESGMPDYKVRYEVRNAGWSFLVEVEHNGEWEIIYDHSAKIGAPEWLD